VECDDSEVFGMAVVSSGEKVVAASGNGALCLVSKEGGILNRVEYESNSLAFAVSNGREMAALPGAQGTVRFVAAKNVSLIAELKRDNGEVNALHFTINDEFLVSGGKDETLRFWPAKEALSIYNSSSSDFEISGKFKALHEELPWLWPLLRRIGYL